MNTQQAYNIWSEQYDTNENKTRDLEAIFAQLNKVIQTNGIVYIGELHPFKQYNGSKARFETSEGLQVVTCFNHHITEFVEAANKNHFELINIKEYFDENDKNNIPRILTLVFLKN
jgi:hypothetical protein